MKRKFEYITRSKSASSVPDPELSHKRRCRDIDVYVFFCFFVFLSFFLIFFERQLHT
jgi:hypothetical protein